MEGGITRRRRRLIRWGRQVPIMSSGSPGAGVGLTPRGSWGRPAATGPFPATATATLASAVRVQEDGDKSTSRAGRAGPTFRLLECPRVSYTDLDTLICKNRSRPSAS